MAKLIDLVQNNIPAKLYHPQLGNIIWDDIENSGFALYFAEGLEQGEPLVVDSSVLYDSTWELLEGLPKRLTLWQIWIEYNKSPLFLGTAFGNTYRQACESYFKQFSPDVFNWTNFTFMGCEILNERDVLRARSNK